MWRPRPSMSIRRAAFAVPTTECRWVWGDSHIFGRERRQSSVPSIAAGNSRFPSCTIRWSYDRRWLRHAHPSAYQRPGGRDSRRKNDGSKDLHIIKKKVFMVRSVRLTLNWFRGQQRNEDATSARNRQIARAYWYMRGESFNGFIDIWHARQGRATIAEFH